MITKAQRVAELSELLETIEAACRIYDLRLGQLMYIVFKDEDIFNIENAIIEKRIIEYLKGN